MIIKKINEDIRVWISRLRKGLAELCVLTGLREGEAYGYEPLEDWDGFDWYSVLEKLPDRTRMALFAGDLRLPPKDRDEALREWPDALKRVKFEGADEQTGNLERAWDLCAAERNSAVLWVHGKLPFDIADTSGLKQRARRVS